MLAERLKIAYLRHRFLSEIERLQTFGGKLGLFRSRDQKELLALRSKYSGRPAVVVGNGPSLRMDDLSAIQNAGFISVASNRIYLAFDKTPWRPHVLTAADELVVEQSAGEINAVDLTKIFPSRLRGVFDRASREQHGKSIYFRAQNTAERDPENYAPIISDDAIRGFFVGQTVTVLNIQIAYWLGCSPIYLIGLDGKYETSEQRAEHKSYGKVAVSEGEANHFVDGYRKKGESWSVPRPDLHEIEYRACRDFCESRNVPILNASRVSYVKAFERTDLDDVLKSAI